MYDLGIINGEVWLDGGYINTNLYVKDGRIAARKFFPALLIHMSIFRLLLPEIHRPMISIQAQ